MKMPDTFHQQSEIANVGLSTVTQNQGIQIGFTAPDSTYDRMRMLNARAVHVNGNVANYVRDPVYKEAWNAWYNQWRPFYEKYAGPNAKLTTKSNVALFRSDELAAQQSAQEGQFESLLADYNQQRTIAGGLVPQIEYTAPTPVPTNNALPWWFWVGGGALLVGIGYLAYRKYQEGVAKKRVLEKYAPSFFEKYLGDWGKPAHEYSQAGRDPYPGSHSNTYPGTTIQPGSYEPFSLNHQIALQSQSPALLTAAPRDPLMPNIRTRQDALERYDYARETVGRGRDYDSDDSDYDDDGDY